MARRRSVPCRETWQPKARPSRAESDERFGLLDPVIDEGPFRVYASIGADLADPDLPQIEDLLKRDET